MVTTPFTPALRRYVETEWTMIVQMATPRARPARMAWFHLQGARAVGEISWMAIAVRGYTRAVRVRRLKEWAADFKDELQALPTTGDAWDSVLDVASGSLGVADVSDQDSNHDVATMAVALVCARQSDPSMCDKARAAVVAAVGTEEGGRWLAVGAADGKIRVWEL